MGQDMSVDISLRRNEGENNITHIVTYGGGRTITRAMPNQSKNFEVVLSTHYTEWSVIPQYGMHAGYQLGGIGISFDPKALVIVCEYDNKYATFGDVMDVNGIFTAVYGGIHYKELNMTLKYKTKPIFTLTGDMFYNITYRTYLICIDQDGMYSYDNKPITSGPMLSEVTYETLPIYDNVVNVVLGHDSVTFDVSKCSYVTNVVSDGTNLILTTSTDVTSNITCISNVNKQSMDVPSLQFKAEYVNSTTIKLVNITLYPLTTLIGPSSTCDISFYFAEINSPYPF
jgi:hypothetical protein